MMLTVAVDTIDYTYRSALHRFTTPARTEEMAATHAALALLCILRGAGACSCPFHSTDQNVSRHGALCLSLSLPLFSLLLSFQLRPCFDSDPG